MAYDDEYRNTLLDGILEEFKTLNSTLRELANSVEPKEPKEEPQNYQQNYVHPSTDTLTSGDYVILNDKFKAVIISDDTDGYVLLTDVTGSTNYRALKSNVKKVPFYEWVNYV